MYTPRTVSDLASEAPTDMYDEWGEDGYRDGDGTGDGGGGGYGLQGTPIDSWSDLSEAMRREQTMLALFNFDIAQQATGEGLALPRAYDAKEDSPNHQLWNTFQGWYGDVYVHV